MKHCRSVLIVLLALSVGILWGGLPRDVLGVPPPGPIAKDLPSLVKASALIIVGEVVDVRQGRTAGEGEARLQFQDVHLRVERRLKGEAPAVVVVEQLPSVGPTVTSEVGPPFQREDRYLLFLRPGEGTRYIPITQGRYFLREGRTTPTEPGLVADRVSGMTEAEFVQEIDGIVRR